MTAFYTENSNGNSAVGAFYRGNQVKIVQGLSIENNYERGILRCSNLACTNR